MISLHAHNTTFTDLSELCARKLDVRVRRATLGPVGQRVRKGTEISDRLVRRLA